MEIILAIAIGLILFDFAASLWGADSRDEVNSTEWQRRASWGHR